MAIKRRFQQIADIHNKYFLQLTPAKLQAYTQSITPSFSPSPSYPLAARKERTVLQRQVSRSVTSKDCRWLLREDFNRLLIFI